MFARRALYVSVAIALGAASPSVLAEGPVILYTNTTHTTLTINGSALCCKTPNVFLGALGPLVVTQQTPTQIVANLPPALLPGDYVLTLSLGRGNDDGNGNSADSVVTIGAQGPTGPTGATGPQGSPGQTGLSGPTGATGANGAAGAMGPTGPQGNVGPAGAQGSQGPKGDSGETGQGFSFAGPWSPSTNYGVDDVVTFDGSSYVSLVNNNAAALLDGNAWAVLASKGDTGNTGATGAQGPQGSQGNTGNTGATGAQGPQGNTGNTGATGAQGTQGNTGNTGATGAQGPAGPPGSPGQFSSYSGVTFGLTYTAQADGWVVGNLSSSLALGDRCRMLGSIDLGSGFVVVGSASIQFNSQIILPYGSFMYPVPKGSKFKVDFFLDSGSCGGSAYLVSQLP